jgi:hypothetical protein
MLDDEIAASPVQVRMSIPAVRKGHKQGQVEDIIASSSLVPADAFFFLLHRFLSKLLQFRGTIPAASYKDE